MARPHAHGGADTTADGIPRGAAFFDVDRTLIAGASALRLARPLQRKGLLSRRQQLATLVQQVGFSMRGADDEVIDQFTQAARAILKGWSRTEFRAVVADELERRVHPTVFREALERIELHRSMGHPVYAVSATIEDIIEPLAALLGLDGAIATQMEVVGDRYTGNVLRACHGEHKTQRVLEFAEHHDIDLAASFSYSDSISDQSFLRITGRAFAVNPDAQLRALAEREGWGMLFFRTRVRAPIHHHRAARISAAALIAGLAVRVVRRRRRSGTRR